MTDIATRIREHLAEVEHEYWCAQSEHQAGCLGEECALGISDSPATTAPTGSQPTGTVAGDPTPGGGQ